MSYIVYPTTTGLSQDAPTPAKMSSPKLSSAAAIFQILEFERDRRLYKLERDEIATRRDAATPSTECPRCIEPAVSADCVTSPSAGSLERGSLSSLEELPVDTFAPQILSPIDSKCLTPDERTSYGPARHNRKKSDGCISYSKSPPRTDNFLSTLSEDGVTPLSDSFKLQSPMGYRLRSCTRMKRSDSNTSQPTLIKSDYDCDSMRGLARTGFVTFHEVITLTARVLKGVMARPQVELLMFRWMTNQGYMSQLSLFDQTQFEDVFNRITSDVIRGLDWDLDGLLSSKDVYDSVHSLLGWKALFAKGAIKRAFSAALAECNIDGDDKISKLELQDLVRRLASQDLKLDALFPHSGLVKLLLSYAK